MTAPAPCPVAAGPSPWTSRVARIAAVRVDAPDVRTFDLVARDGGLEPPFLPGQFNMLLLPGIGECAISISSDPAVASPVGHTFRAVGNVTHALARLGVGAEIVVRGPFGRPWPLDELRGRDVIVAAGGLGIASMRAAILALAARRGDYGAITILFGATAPERLLYAAEYAVWRRAGLDVRTIVDAADAGWTGPTGFVPALFDDLAVACRRTSLLGCGPERMMTAVADRAIAAGVTPADIFLSMERNMACAAGFCGLCQFGPAFVCKDGPVFRYDFLAPYLAVSHL